MDDRYQNHDQNKILNSTLQAVEKQKEFINRAIKDFVSIFIK